MHFHYTEKFLPLFHIAENIGNTGIHNQEYIFSLNIDFPQVSIIVYTSMKNSE